MPRRLLRSDRLRTRTKKIMSIYEFNVSVLNHSINIKVIKNQSYFLIDSRKILIFLLKVDGVSVGLRKRAPGTITLSFFYKIRRVLDSCPYVAKADKYWKVTMMHIVSWSRAIHFSRNNLLWAWARIITLLSLRISYSEVTLFFWDLLSSKNYKVLIIFFGFRKKRVY